MRVANGDTADLLLQLIDLDSPRSTNVYNRYVPSSNATMNVQLFNNNSALNMNKIATMPFPDDKSIWKLHLSSCDTKKLNSVTIMAKLTDGASVQTITATSVIIVDPTSPFQC